jgi:hypothetical protein
MSMPNLEKVDRYDTGANAWIPEQNVHEVGGYRIDLGFKPKYVIRTPEDLESGTVRYCSAEFAKHYQANCEEKPLFIYRYAGGDLLTPLGATLPGLYGRAAYLFSGLLPLKVSEKNIVSYSDVPVGASRELAYKMSH